MPELAFELGKGAHVDEADLRTMLGDPLRRDLGEACIPTPVPGRTQGYDGSLRASYAHLVVVDAEDREVPAEMVVVDGDILLVIDDARADDWDLATKRDLIEKAYKALPEGGALVVYEAIIDDARTKNAFGLMMSLNMLIETTGGFDYTGADCCAWMRDAGFRTTRVEALVGPDSMVVGLK